MPVQLTLTPVRRFEARLGERGIATNLRASKLALLASLLLGCSGAAGETDATVAQDTGPQTGAILEAFFGLDNALPLTVNLLCPGGGGLDGMPVTFSRRIGVDQPEASAFRITTRSGQVLTPRCATLRPALAPSKRHTVLLIGELGDASDPPVRVEVVGSVPWQNGGDASGLAIDTVTPLAEGPSLRIAYRYAPGELRTSCPAGTQQIVQITWAGGVTATTGGELGEAARVGMRVTLEDGTVVTQRALADLGDNDNYTQLCLDTATPATEVSVDAGLAQDPRGDANPATSLRITSDPEPQ